MYYFCRFALSIRGGHTKYCGRDWLWCSARLAQKWDFQAAEAYAVALAEQSKVRLKTIQIVVYLIHRNRVQ